MATPKPWTLHHTKTGNPIVLHSAGASICTFPGHSLADWSRARLIAAAPQLLEALRAVVDYGMDTERWAKARDAIKAATAGRQAP